MSREAMLAAALRTTSELITQDLANSARARVTPLHHGVPSLAVACTELAPKLSELERQELSNTA